MNSSSDCKKTSLVVNTSAICARTVQRCHLNSSFRAHLLKDVLQVPDLDAAVHGGGEDTVLLAKDQGFHLDNPLEVGRQAAYKAPIAEACKSVGNTVNF
jgi:hypothetical protein